MRSFWYAVTTALVVGLAVSALWVAVDKVTEPDWESATATVTRSSHEVAITRRYSENQVDIEVAGIEHRGVHAPADWRRGDRVSVWAHGDDVRAYKPGTDSVAVLGVGAMAAFAGFALAALQIVLADGQKSARRREDLSYYYR